ncbi:TPA: DUF1240 domain-containing protein [Morganella morganii]|nr:DUF1240 domain-containing protein [Morganella morganii]MCU6212081.1 DUF1240 domain-containing protein [Morganella morganii]MCU6226458.1 DUF1240 domain-containing protein [Morganella morganii]MCU6233332.1 DUF1240 domain-containing protein [Morganella morganii]MCU6239378.1 DUF1240 domain-containing protein [Morganella morganii]
MKKIIMLGVAMLVVGMVVLYPFFLSINSIYKVISKKDILEMSYGVVICLVMPMITYLCIDISLRGMYLHFFKKEKIKSTYKISGVIIALWIFLSFPISWGMSFYLTSNGYERCPSTNLFTQYYTTNLSLCSDPYYEERASTE